MTQPPRDIPTESPAPKDWEIIKDALADLLEAPRLERDELLARLDPHIALEVQNLLSANDRTTGMIDARTDRWIGLDGPDMSDLAGQRIGPFTLKKLLGEGSLSAVYLAEQDEPRRSVAIKVFRGHAALIDIDRAFQREVAALGRLEHEHIARIYHAGKSGDSMHQFPYIAMEYVDGAPITHHVRQYHCSLEERLNLMIDVADAVHAAHQKALIHRDLKPANIMVRKDGVVKVLDFGIARLIEPDEQFAASHTVTGVLLGTLGYMSPEQLSTSGQIDVRSDVWALGTILLELLTDKPWIDLAGLSMPEMLRRLDNAEVPAPRSRMRDLPIELDGIVLKACARDAKDRYASAAAFADDLRRVLRHEPVLAQPPTTLYVARKFARRHRAALSIAAAFAFILMGATLVSSIGFYRASIQRDAAIASEQRVQAVNTFLQTMLGAADPMTGSKDVTVANTLDIATAQLDSGQWQVEPMTQAALYSTIGLTWFSLGDYERSTDALQKAVDIQLREVGPEDVRTIDDQSRLIMSLRWQYKPEQAKAILDRVLPVAIETLGENSESVFPLLDHQAGLASELGDLEESARLYRKLYESAKQAGRGDDEHVLNAGNNYAQALMQTGQYAEAEPIFREVIEKRNKNPKLGPASIVTTSSNLAMTLDRLGRSREALEIQEQNLQRAIEIFGEDHDTTLSVRIGLSDIYRSFGQSDRSLEISQDIYQRHVAKHGPLHTNTIQMAGNLIIMYAEAKRWQDAWDFGTQILSVEPTAGEDAAPIFANIKNALARVLSELDQPARAVELGKEALSYLESVNGIDSPLTMFAHSNLSIAYDKLGDHESALKHADRALELNSMRESATVVGLLKKYRGRVLVNAGRIEEGIAVLQSAFDLQGNATNPQIPAGIADELAIAYERIGDTTSAAHWTAQASQLRARLEAVQP